MTMQIATSDSKPVSLRMPVSSVQAIARSGKSEILSREDIAGRFSMIASGPMRIQMEAGTILHVRAGSVHSTQFVGKHERCVAEGENFVAERDGLLTIRCRTHAELQIDWPGIGSVAASVI